MRKHSRRKKYKQRQKQKQRQKVVVNVGGGGGFGKAVVPPAAYFAPSLPISMAPPMVKQAQMGKLPGLMGELPPVAVNMEAGKRIPEPPVYERPAQIPESVYTRPRMFPRRPAFSREGLSAVRQPIKFETPVRPMPKEWTGPREEQALREQPAPLSSREASPKTVLPSIVSEEGGAKAEENPSREFSRATRGVPAARFTPS
jgi:hypothetical protein